MQLILENLDQIRKVAITHHVESLEVFGSLTTGSFYESSDVDLIVEFKKGNFKYFSNYRSFIFKLQAILGREIDLLIKSEIRNTTFLKNIQNQRVLIYER